MPSTDAWAVADAAVLTALDDKHPRTAGELHLDLDSSVVRAVLAQNVHAGLVAAHHDASRTTYTITEAGKRHLADTLEVA